MKLNDAALLLVAEDEALLRDFLEDGLAENGFGVVLAKDGAEALRELEARADQLRGLVTDIRLGIGPNGWEIAHRARELVPNLPIVYISGDSLHEWSANGVPESVILQKPFILAQLVTALTNLMNKVTSTLPNPPSAE